MSSRKFVCDFNGCHSAFAQSGNLTNHKRTHTGEKPFICDFDGCGSAFAQRSCLTKHKRAHTGEKPFICDFDGCGSAFAQSGCLTKHKRTHTREKPFICDFHGCGSAFAQSGCLTKHKRAHTGEKPFICDFDGCGSAFSCAINLKVHKMTHTGEKPFTCDFDGCGSAFAQSGSLTKHKKTHTIEHQQRKKREEQKVAKLLENHGIDFKREHQVDFSCMGSTFARIDFLIVKDGVAIFLEVDENQHKFGGYSVACDMKRMANIYESLVFDDNTLPLYFIRYNPHAYMVGGELQKTKSVFRQQYLVNVINSINSTTVKRMNILYMYFDCDTLVDGNIRLSVHTDPEYNETMKKCCLHPVY